MEFGVKKKPYVRNPPVVKRHENYHGSNSENTSFILGLGASGGLNNHILIIKVQFLKVKWYGIDDRQCMTLLLYDFAHRRLKF